MIHNLVISNVPGPPVPLYFMGAQIEGLYPLGPVFHGAGLNITVMSSDGKVHVGAIACRELVPEPWKLTEKFPEELDALHAAATSGRTPKKATAKKAPAKKTPPRRRSRRPRRPDSPNEWPLRGCAAWSQSGLSGLRIQPLPVPHPGGGDVDGLEEGRDEAVGLERRSRRGRSRASWTVAPGIRAASRR